jgi:hypothetical protein
MQMAYERSSNSSDSNASGVHETKDEDRAQEEKEIQNRTPELGPLDLEPDA